MFNKNKRVWFVSLAFWGLALLSENGLLAAMDTGVINQNTGQTYTNEQLQEAINEANSGDVLALSGTFLGSFNIYDKSLTLQGPDGGVAILDGQFQGRVLEIIGPSADNYSNVTLKQLTIHQGHAQQTSNNGPNGGGILAAYTDLTLSSVTLEYNFASCGGGIALCYAKGNIQGSTIGNNVAAIGGGIDALSCELVIDSSLIASNAEIQGGGGGLIVNGSNVTLQNETSFDSNASLLHGGGLFNSLGGKTICNNVSFSSNTTFGNGAGIYNSAVFSASSTTIFGNVSGGDGGGLCNEIIPNANSGQGSNSPLVEVALSQSQIFGNQSEQGNGGGIYNGASTVLSTIDTDIVSNTSFSNGGGLYNAALADLQKGQISSNAAGVDGGGIYNSSSSTLTTKKTDILNNSCSSNGGGLYNAASLLGSASATSATLKKGLISNNTAGASGGGIYNGRGALLQNSATVSYNDPDDVYQQ